MAFYELRYAYKILKYFSTSHVACWHFAMRRMKMYTLTRRFSELFSRPRRCSFTHLNGYKSKFHFHHDGKVLNLFSYCPVGNK